MSNDKTRTLRFFWPMLHGTISKAMAKCGQKNCKCRKNPNELHGPYYRWTGRLNGKITTKTLTKELAQECQRRIKNYQKLQRKIEELINEASDSAPWTQSDDKINK
jgi:hypothetical protein